MPIRFGECTFDPVRREVKRGGRRVHLTPRAFALLRLLVENRPRALGKNQIAARLWPGSACSDASLAVLVAEIRRELGDDTRRPRFLRTVHGYGYAFSEEAASSIEEDGGTAFRIIQAAREIPLVEGENVLGRDSGAAVAIDDATVSRHHARIVVEGDRAILEDLGSKNGTWLDGRQVVSPEPLRDGDEIRIGPASMVLRRLAAQDSTQTHME